MARARLARARLARARLARAWLALGGLVASRLGRRLARTRGRGAGAWTLPRDAMGAPKLPQLRRGLPRHAGAMRVPSDSSSECTACVAPPPCRWPRLSLGLEGRPGVVRAFPQPPALMLP